MHCVFQVWAIVDSDSDGKPEYTWQLVKNLNTPSGIALDGKHDILYVSGFEGPVDGLKGMVWALKDVSKYALSKKVCADTLMLICTAPQPVRGVLGCNLMCTMLPNSHQQQQAGCHCAATHPEDSSKTYPTGTHECIINMEYHQSDACYRVD